MSYHNRSNRVTRVAAQSAVRAPSALPVIKPQPKAPTKPRIKPIVTTKPKSIVNPRPKPVNPQPKIAPEGYHYMPDGSLMSNVEHARLYDSKMGLKTIQKISLDFNNIAERGETRSFRIHGDRGAIFSFEIKRGTDYYNFKTNLFQATRTRLSNVSIPTDGFYSGNIVFPKVTVGAQFDLYLWAEDVYGSKHAIHSEVRFSDGSMDINSSTGSNSNLMQKVLYQTLDTSTILSHFSPNGTISISNTDQTLKRSRGKNYPTYFPFEISTTIASTSGLSIDRQPTTSDIMAFVTRTIGDPTNIPGENIYPTATAAFTGDDINGAVTSGSVVRMDNTDLSAVIKVGDKITTPTTTSNVAGAVESGIVVSLGVVAATKMAVGDQVTAPTFESPINSRVVTVAALDPSGSNDEQFSLSEAIAFDDGTALVFSSKINRSLTTVTVVETGSVATDFTMSQAIQFRDNAPLTFFNRRNYRWSIDNIDGIINGMRSVPGVYFASTPTISDFSTYVTINEGEISEKTLLITRTPSLDTLGAKPVFTRNGTTKVKTVAQTGNVVFSEQALLSFSGVDARIYGYGLSEIERLSGYDIDFTDLRAELTKVATTTTAAVSNNAVIPVTSKNGIAAPTTQTVDGAITDSKTVVLDSVDGLGVGQSLYAVSAGTLTGIPTITTINETTKTITLSTDQTFADGITLTFPNSIISGIGIDPEVVNPYVASIASLNLTASAAQTLENAQTFTFTGAGTQVTITGNIRINKVGNEDITLRFDVEKFLTSHAN